MASLAFLQGGPAPPFALPPSDTELQKRIDTLAAYAGRNGAQGPDATVQSVPLAPRAAATPNCLIQRRPELRANDGRAAGQQPRVCVPIRRPWARVLRLGAVLQPQQPAGVKAAAGAGSPARRSRRRSCRRRRAAASAAASPGHRRCAAGPPRGGQQRLAAGAGPAERLPGQHPKQPGLVHGMRAVRRRDGRNDAAGERMGGTLPLLAALHCAPPSLRMS